MKRSRKAGFKPQDRINILSRNTVELESYKYDNATSQETNQGRKKILRDLDIPRQNLIILKKIGEGAFGVVFEATLATVDGSVRVAVKRVKENEDELEKADSSLMDELEVMHRIRKHPNIVELIGVCSSEGPLYLVTEYLPAGSLLGLLRKYRSKNDEPFAEVSEHELLRLALGVCEGMEYLAQCGLIHGDLAARNILMNEHGSPKLSDFGFSRDYQGSKLLSSRNKDGQRTFPLKWMAIESLRLHIFTKKSDVWSFGVVLWEIMTLGGSPYPGVPSRHLLKRLLVGYRMEKPIHCSDEIYDVMKSCWEAEPAVRVGFSDVGTVLRHLLTLTERRDFISLEILNSLFPYMDLGQNSTDSLDDIDTSDTKL